MSVCLGDGANDLFGIARLLQEIKGTVMDGPKRGPDGPVGRENEDFDGRIASLEPELTGSLAEAFLNQPGGDADPLRLEVNFTSGFGHHRESAHMDRH